MAYNSEYLTMKHEAERLRSWRMKQNRIAVKRSVAACHHKRNNTVKEMDPALQDRILRVLNKDKPSSGISMRDFKLAQAAAQKQAAAARVRDEKRGEQLTKQLEARGYTWGEMRS